MTAASESPEYRRNNTAKRREKAIAEGKCASLCGTPMNPLDINRSTGRAYVTCQECCKKQWESRKKHRVADIE